MSSVHDFGAVGDGVTDAASPAGNWLKRRSVEMCAGDSLKFRPEQKLETIRVSDQSHYAASQVT